MLFITIGCGVVSIMQLMGYDHIYSLLYFDRDLILEGQVWRLITCVFTMAGSSPFMTLILLYCCYSLGRAVDISLVNRASGKELRMPTKVHDFSENAGRSASANWEWTLKNNVDYMTGVMESVGFKTIDGEWWHFENPGTTGLDTELDYDALTYIPVAQYGADAPADTATAEGEAQ
jgi:hypothetical protein